MNAERELIDVGLLTTQIEDANLGVGNTSVESRLGVGLVLAVAVTSCWTTCHLDGFRCGVVGRFGVVVVGGREIVVLLY